MTLISPLFENENNQQDVTTKWSNVVLDFLDAIINRDYKTLENIYAPDVVYESNLFDNGIDHAATLDFWKFILASPEKPYVRLLLMAPHQSKCRFFIVFRHPVTKQCVTMDVNTIFTIRDGKIYHQTDKINKRLFFSHVNGVFGPLLSLIPGAIKYFRKQFINQVFHNKTSNRNNLFMY